MKYCWCNIAIFHDRARNICIFPRDFSHSFQKSFADGDSQWRRPFGPRTKIRRVRLQKEKGEDPWVTIGKAPSLPSGGYIIKWKIPNENIATIVVNQQWANRFIGDSNIATENPQCIGDYTIKHGDRKRTI